MNTTTFSNALLPLAGTDGTPARDEQARPSFFTRFMEAMHKSREAQARRHIARVEEMLGYSIVDRTAFVRSDLPFQR